MQARRKVVGLCAAALALTAVVGAGFSAWTFVDGGANVEAELGVHVTSVEGAVGEMTVPAAYRLVLDQGGADNKTDAAKGISIETDASGTYETAMEISVDWSVDTTVYTQTAYTFEYSLNVYVKTGDFSKYVQLVSNDFEEVTSDKNDYYIKYEYKGTLDATAVTDGYTVKYTIEDNLFQYYSATETDADGAVTKYAKPQDLASYEAMVSAITGQTYDAKNTDGYTATVADYVIFEFAVTVTEK